ncbi:MAG: hypothetical protein QOE45_1339 [Frankiaceae bacterium]|jgi:hypothetical protein|nr:hypothetical protein [Frankiaceae bacterium]
MAPPPGYVDPRGPRFGAWVTTVVLALVLLTRSPWLAAAQTLVFLTGAAFGLSKAPYGVLYRRLVAPRLGPPSDFEAELPPRFAQAVGAAFGAVATLGLLAGSTAVGLGAAALALAAAFLNAAFAFCLGCEVLLLARRVLGRAEITRFVPRPTSKGASA